MTCLYSELALTLAAQARQIGEISLKKMVPHAGIAKLFTALEVLPF